MNNKEEKLLNYVNERVIHCLCLNIDKKYITEWLDDVIFDLPEDASPELFSILYKIQDNLLLNNEF